MKLELHATIVVITDKGDRHLDVHDLNYDPDTLMFTYIHGRRYTATTRENVRGYENNDND